MSLPLVASPAPEKAQAPPAWLAWLSLVLLIGSGLYGSLFWLGHDAGPSASQIETAAKALRAEHQAGDLILLVPHYATRAREYLGDLHPLAVRAPMLEDLQKHPRIWVFGLFEEAQALRPQMLAAGHRLLQTKNPAPGVTVDLFQTAEPYEVVYDFLNTLKSASVWHEQEGKNTACDTWSPRNGHGGNFGRWTCPKDRDWFYVTPQWHRMGDHLRLCLWAHPPTKGRLMIRFPGVPLTGHLAGRAGHTLNSSQRAQAPVHLDVHVEGQGEQRFEFALEQHFEPFKLRTPQTGTATITFGVSSPNAGANHFCFIADMRRPKAP